MGHAPIDDVYVNAAGPDKAAVRLLGRKWIYDYGTVANFRTYDLDNTTTVAINGTIWTYDPADSTTADDGSTCIIDASGTRRFKIPPVFAAALASASGSATSAAAAAAAAAASAASAVPTIYEPGGRLTWLTGQPIPAQGQSTPAGGVTTIYYTPYKAGGGRISVYNGTALITFNYFAGGTDISLTTAGLTASKCYDVFLAYNAGSPVLCFGPAWTTAGLGGINGVRAASGAVVRGGGLLYGLHVNASSMSATASGTAITVPANQGTWLGTVYINAGVKIDFHFGSYNGAGVASTPAIFGIWNKYNKVQIGATINDGQNPYTYASSTYRPPGNTQGMYVYFVCGELGDAFTAANESYVQTNTTLGGAALTGIVMDVFTQPAVLFNGYTSNPGTNAFRTVQQSAGTYNMYLLGIHAVACFEWGDGTNAYTYNYVQAGQISFTYFM